MVGDVSRFVALASVSSHLPTASGARNMGRPITDRHTGTVSGLCNSRVSRTLKEDLCR